jgi:hypothetical protein
MTAARIEMAINTLLHELEQGADDDHLATAIARHLTDDPAENRKILGAVRTLRLLIGERSVAPLDRRV